MSAAHRPALAEKLSDKPYNPPDLRGIVRARTIVTGQSPAASIRHGQRRRTWQTRTTMPNRWA
ncbi:hypothetical protein SGPA1_30657 [Streptomyces misionensis JCM 4497]